MASKTSSKCIKKDVQNHRTGYKAGCRCKKCVQAYADYRKEYYSRPEIKERRHYSHQRDLEKPSNRARQLIYSARARACCSLSQSWVKKKIEAGCAIMGIPFDMEQGNGVRPLGPSLDRIDPKGGYHPSNVRLVCLIFNKAKAQWTDEDVKHMVRRLQTWAKS